MSPPNVLLESMTMGVHVVSSNTGGVSEIVIDGETGSWSSRGNKSVLTDAIKKVWTNQNNYQEMKINALKLIVNQFDKATRFEPRIIS